MAVVLSLITSALWGTSDFFGGLATRRSPVAQVMLWVHGIGLVAVFAVAPLLADTITVRDLALGAVAGVFGLVGLLLLYWALATGPMAVVAPLSALTAALLPVLWGLGSDDPLSRTTLIGLLVGLVAVVTISWERSAGPGVTLNIALAAVIAGLGFGSIVLLYDATSEQGAPWPVVSGRVVTTALLVGFALVKRRDLSPGPTLGFAAVAGLGDTFANVTLLLATSRATTASELSVVAVLAALYPAATVLWARFRLGEPLGPVRVLGLGAALLAIALMTLG